MKIKDILNNLPEVDQPILNLVYSYSLTNLSYWQELFYKGKNTISEEFLIIKDNLISSMLLSNYGYYEQAGALLRISFENIFNIIVKHTEIRLPEDTSRNLNLKDTSEKMQTLMQTSPISYDHDKIYTLYKELCQPIHNPSSSILTSDMSNTPGFIQYDHNKYKKRLNMFVNISSEMLFVMSLYLNINNTKHLEPLINIFDEKTAKKISKYYNFNFETYYYSNLSVKL